MLVDDDACTQQRAKQECKYRQQEDADAHWKLGARLNLTDSMLIESLRKAQLLYKNFHKSLYQFLSANVADDCVHPDEPIKVREQK